MNYEELIDLVLEGKSVNSRSKELGLPQKTLDQYVKARSLPDCDTVIILAKAANVSIESAVIAVAAKKKELRPERTHAFPRFATAAVLGSIVAVNLFLTPSPAQAAPALTLKSATLYIM